MNRPPFLTAPSPAALTSRDREALARSFDIAGLRLTMTASALVMEGQVSCYRMKKLAGKATARLPGAVRVVNRLRVVPQRHRRDPEVVEAVRVALRASSSLADANITVSAHDGIVALRGDVFSAGVRCEAEVVAWAVCGVMDVEDQLRL